MSRETPDQEKKALASVLAALERAGEKELPVEEEYFNRLHDRIMLKIETREIERAPRWNWLLARPKKYLQAHWKGWLATSLSLGMALIVAVQISNSFQSLFSESHTVQVVKNEKEFLRSALGSPQDFSQSLISYQKQEDFVSDFASHQLSDEQVRRLFSEN